MLQKFKAVTCEAFSNTRELPQEQAARERREAAQAAARAALSLPPGNCKGKKQAGDPQLCKFNLSTYKIHCHSFSAFIHQMLVT
jgi:hypothetical protein